MNLIPHFVLSLLVSCTFVSASFAEVRLPSVFTNHMVLQRNMPAPVWGWADAGETVHVVFGDQTKQTKADDAGRWRVTLEPLSVGKPRSLVVEGTNRVEVKDVLVGEVWICSGQSNMQWTLQQSSDGDLELASADVPEIRLLTVAGAGMQSPLDDFDGAWEVCSPGT
ncbi:MAG: sialate O-acetylesterase, partial [Aeoliella sp.]